MTTIYTDIDQARQKITARQELKGQVEDWWYEQGWGMPPLPNIQHMAVLARHVATARFEDLVFWLIAQDAGLNPTWLEYTDDKFVDRSSYKRSLVKRILCAGKGRNGGWKRSVDNVLRVESCKGRRISDLVIPGGQSLVDFHHALQNEMIPGVVVRSEFSGWLKRIGDGTAHHYYAAYLSCFIAHGVLFEDYHGGESGQELDGFTNNVFERAHAMVVNHFGVNPLLVKMPWWEGMDFYPANPNWHEHQVIPEYMLRDRIA